MRRSTEFSALSTTLRAPVSGAIALAAVLACFDAGTTSVAPAPDAITRVPVASVIFNIPDSVKERLAAEEAASGMRAVPIGPTANVVAVPGSAAANVAASCGGGSGFAGYAKSRVAFSPEAIPLIAPFPIGDEGYIPADNVRLGFNFNFEGNTYDRVNVYFNGFLLFGAAPGGQNVGYSSAGFIASSALPNNIIALAWTDWDGSKAPDGIRYETRGTAPNRKFVLQFNNVPEYHSTGMLMSQVVLSEGSNAITIYTNSMTVRNSSHFVTQGIENAPGTEANYDSVTNVKTGITSMRVKNFFDLTNDAVRFTPISTKDEVPPTITAPVNLTHDNDPGLASAVVAVAPPAAQDNCTAVTVTGVRSDGVASLDAPYPVGVTTITWTAKDADLNTSTATQTVTVVDVEDPTLAVSDMIVPATTRNGALVNYQLEAHDNVGVTSVDCDKLSGSLFPIGSTTVTCTASDAARNVSSPASFNVLVLSAQAQMDNLIHYVISLHLPDGTTNPLVNQLTVAYSDNNSCKKMSDFISMVSKKGRDLPFGSAPYMTGEATRIMVVLGCSNTPSRGALFNPALLGN